ncbi:hypothetical protein BDQ12DRAFT_226172 [Crucibulum laeve]|uniref:Uncharacterized protein n=1 Tax=Crucibulum laeve TaxID=68775 RepID=A0A5C3LW96_9AGAR|nr:hypothetical protein BDQ12DRAFT_226172 [Crucibulum laeve]
MSISRSKSAPHTIVSMTPSRLARSGSHQYLPGENWGQSSRGTKVTTRRERGDPFSLLGFFPVSLTGIESEDEWQWLREEERRDEKYEGGTSRSQSIFGEKDEKGTGEAIKGEDKLGVLSLGEYTMVFGQVAGDDERLMSPYWEEAVDEESLYLGLCARRKRHGAETMRSEGGTGFGLLFFPEE